MSQFLPTRASPPLKPSKSQLITNAEYSVPELADLGREDVDLLDAVIQRAGPTANTFLTIFKAYNDVLSERNLDPHEVEYYGKLLKLGTLKGKNWGDKWDMVKSHYGYHSTTTTRPTPAKIPPTTLRPLPAPRYPHDDTLLTLGSTVKDTLRDSPQESLESPLLTRRASPLSVISKRNQKLLPSLAPLPSSKRPVPSQRLPPTQSTLSTWEDDTDVTPESAPNDTTTTPPSYRASARPVLPVSTTALAVASNPPRGSVIREDDAWAKIKMERDEKDAEKFREDRLVERCWDVWYQGFQWILTTERQIAEARDNVLLRLCMQRLQNRYTSHQQLYDQVAEVSNTRLLKTVLESWHQRYKEKQVAQWRREMRKKMKIVRDKRDQHIKSSSLRRWRQLFQAHLFQRNSDMDLALRALALWRTRLDRIRSLELQATEFAQSSRNASVSVYWNIWRKTLNIRNAEATMRQRVDMRIMVEVLSQWKQRMDDLATAQQYHEFRLQVKIVERWRSARLRILNLKARAVKHLAKQDALLLHAVFRVWDARTQGRRLERARNIKLQREFWNAWTERSRILKAREALAAQFSTRAGCSTLTTALMRWQHVLGSHRNAKDYAVRHHAAQVRSDVFLKWRVKAYNQQKLLLVAERTFAIRRTWRTWARRLNERRQERSVKLVETTAVKKYFQEWANRTRRKREHQVLESVVRERLALRIQQQALGRWTERVIEIKSREYEVVLQYNRRAQMEVLQKWKTTFQRHNERLSLMESYQDVRREESVRRIFHYWQTMARGRRYRRIALQQKEDRLRLALISTAWGKWRERFHNERLRPIEETVVIQMQRNLLFRVFGQWHSQTKSLPAIRFHASHTKARMFKIWQQAMPRALQAKEARQIDRKAVLARCLDKWLRVHRAKLALKAVARARYLRLPTAAPRENRVALPIPPLLSTRDSSPTRGSGKSDGFAQGSNPSPPPLSSHIRRSPFTALTPTGTSFTPTRSRTQEHSPTHSTTSFGGFGRTTKDTSPTRFPSRPASSVAGSEFRKGTLWQELRNIQRRSQPPTERTRSPTP